MSAQTAIDAQDRRAMRRALALALRGSGQTGSNPLVGAVVIKDGAIVGQGWHRRFGGAHGEIEALEQAGPAAHGAELYVTLEPCDHFGKTPPCSEAVIRSGVRRVVVGMRDPNPRAQGGLERLERAGIAVRAGVLEHEVRTLNSGWLKLLLSGRPEVVLKLAVSLDGRIAAADRARRQLSSPTAAAQVQRLRSRADAVLVGIETVRRDNPALTNRSGRGAHPLRVIIDPRLTINAEAQVLCGDPWESRVTGLQARAVVLHSADVSPGRAKSLADEGVFCLPAPVVSSDSSALRLDVLFKFLGEHGIKQVLCEGGAGTAARLLQARYLDRLILYHTPHLLGADGVPLFAFSSEDARHAGAAFSLKKVRRIGADLVSEYEVGYRDRG